MSHILGNNLPEIAESTPTTSIDAPLVDCLQTTPTGFIPVMTQGYGVILHVREIIARSFSEEARFRDTVHTIVSL